MRVLLVIDTLSFGGAENLLVTLARQAGDIDVEFDVAVIAPPEDARGAWLPNLRGAGLEPRFLGIRRLAQPDALTRLSRVVRASGCDVVHAHLGTASTLAPIAAGLAGRPSVCTLHHIPEKLTGREAVRERISVSVASRSRGLLFVSRASMEAFRRRYPLARTSSWRVLANGVDLRTFHPRRAGDRSDHEVRADLGVPPGVPLVSLVAHMRPGKGHEEAVVAWRDVLDQHADAHLVLVGDGPLEERLHRRARELGIENRVVFAGRRDDVADVLRSSALVLLPSRIEALPTVLIEAAACGIPAVASAVGGVPEVVDDGATGWLLDDAQPGGIATAVDKALADPAHLLATGHAARLRAEQRFDAAQWARSLRGIYLDATRRRAATFPRERR
jgi:glycosyltransferase involved in cell wall biosynthesis